MCSSGRQYVVIKAEPLTEGILQHIFLVYCEAEVVPYLLQLGCGRNNLVFIKIE